MIYNCLHSFLHQHTCKAVTRQTLSLRDRVKHTHSADCWQNRNWFETTQMLLTRVEHQLFFCLLVHYELRIFELCAPDAVSWFAHLSNISNFLRKNVFFFWYFRWSLEREKKTASVEIFGWVKEQAKGGMQKRLAWEMTQLESMSKKEKKRTNDWIRKKRSFAVTMTIAKRDIQWAQ